MKIAVRFALPWIVSSVILAPSNARLEEKTPAPEPVASQTSAPEAAVEGQPGNLVMPDSKSGSQQESTSEGTAAGEKAGDDNRYVVQTGDTLWDISAARLSDPFLWPLLWKENRTIANPDLIYPGNILIIPGLGPVERALAPDPVEEVRPETVERAAPIVPVKKTETARVDKAAPAPVDEPATEPEDAGIPIIDKYRMLSAGFISNETWPDKIVGSPEPKTILGYDDIVYIKTGSGKPVSVGDKFLIYEPVRKVKDPRTGRLIGNLIQVNGVLEVFRTNEGDFPSARITLSFKDAHIGDQIAPYQEPALIKGPAGADGRMIEGRIVEVMDKRSMNAESDIVFIDKGSADGVRPGDRFQVILESLRKGFPEQYLGEILVFIVKEKTSTALVRKSTNVMAKGAKVTLAARP